MGRLDMSVQVVPQQKNGISHNILVCVFDANVAIGRRDVAVGEFVKSLLWVVGEDDKGGWRLHR